MRVTLIGICVGVVGMIAIGFLGSSAAAPPHESSTDTRQRLIFANPARSNSSRNAPNARVCKRDHPGLSDR